MKAPAPVQVLSLDGDTGTAGPGWEAPGEGLPLAGCGRSYFSGDPVVGSAYYCPGCAGLGAPGSRTSGEWLQGARGLPFVDVYLLMALLLPTELSWTLSPEGMSGLSLPTFQAILA